MGRRVNGVRLFVGKDEEVVDEVMARILRIGRGLRGRDKGRNVRVGRGWRGERW